MIGARVSTLPHEPELRGAAAEKMLELVGEARFDATDLDRAFPGVIHELDRDGKLLGSDLDKNIQERDAHHIHHWADGGPTSLDNLVLLCRKHHTVVHHTPWRVELDPHTRRPVWIPPPLVDDTHRFSYRPPTRPPPLVA